MNWTKIAKQIGLWGWIAPLTGLVGSLLYLDYYYRIAYYNGDGYSLASSKWFPALVILGVIGSFWIISLVIHELRRTRQQTAETMDAEREALADEIDALQNERKRMKKLRGQVQDASEGQTEGARQLSQAVQRFEATLNDHEVHQYREQVLRETIQAMKDENTTRMIDLLKEADNRL